MKNVLPIQSVADIITNSSSEVFIVEKDDMLHYLDVYDEQYMDCFDVKKITREYIKCDEWMSWDVDHGWDIPYEYVFGLLRMTVKEAKEEGVKFVWRENETYTGETEKWLVPLDEGNEFDGKANETKKESEKREKARKVAAKEFHKSWVDFCKKHEKDLRDKVLGKYVMEVEDHFDEWSNFREEIESKGWLYRESHH